MTEALAGRDLGVRPVLAARLQRRSVALSAVSALLYAVSTALMSYGGLLGRTTNLTFVLLGVLTFVAAAGVGVLREWAQRWVDRGQREAATNLHLAVNDALKPVAERIALMPGMRAAERRAQLDQVAQQVTGAVGLLLRDVDGLRTVVYSLTAVDRMDPIAYQGRGDAPQPFLRRTDGRADLPFDALERNESRRVPDAGRGSSEPETRRSYRAFIAVPIVVGDTGYGMLTVDAPDADAFTDTDQRLCELGCELLAVAFAIAGG